MSTCRISRGNIVIIGSGPGAYEAALVAKQMGAAVTLINRDGIGSTAVITDCVPSERINRGINLQTVNARVRDLAHAQSTDITAALVREGVEIVNASGPFINANTVVATYKDGATVGVSQKELDSGEIRGDMYLLPVLAQKKMQEQNDGFIKIFCRKTSRTHSGNSGAPYCRRIGIGFHSFRSLSGSIAEAARRLHNSSE